MNSGVKTWVASIHFTITMNPVKIYDLTLV